MKCPLCKTPMVGFVDQFFPTGASGAGIWTFRGFKMWKCNSCDKYFHKNYDVIKSYPIDNPEGITRLF